MSVKDKLINLVIRGKDLLTPAANASQKALKDLEQTASDTKDELQTLESQASDVLKALDLQDELEKQKSAMLDASDAAIKYATDLQRTTDALKAKKDELKAAEVAEKAAVKAADAATDAIDANATAIADSEAATEKFVLSLDDLTEKSKAQAATVERNKQAVADFAVELDNSETVTKAQATAFAELKKTLTQSQSKFRSIEKAIEKTTQKIDDQKAATATLIANNDDLAQAAADAADALQNSRNAVAQVSDELGGMATVTEQNKATMQRLNRQVTATERAYDSTAKALGKTLVELKKAGVATDDLTDTYLQLDQRVEDLSNTLTDAQVQAKEFAEQLKINDSIDQQTASVNDAILSFERYTAVLQQGSEPTDRQIAQQRKLIANAESMVEEFNLGTIAIAEQIAVLSSAGKDTSKLVQQHDALAQSAADLAAQLDTAKASAEQFADRVVADKNLQKQTDTLRANVDALEDYTAALKKTDQPSQQQILQQQRMHDAAAQSLRQMKLMAFELQRQISNLKANGESTAHLEKRFYALATATQDLNGRIEQTRVHFEQQNTAMDATGQIAKSVREEFSNLTTSIMAMGAAYLGIDLVTNALRKFFTTAGQMEDFRYQLIGAFNDVEKGSEAFDWIVDFTKEVPNKIEDVTQAFIMLKNQGMEPTDGSLKNIIAANAKYGKGVETLVPVIRQLTQSWAKNKLQAEEIYVLVENGIPVWNLLEKALDKNAYQLSKMSENGELTRRELKLLIDEMGKSSMSAMAQRMESFNAQLAKMSDRINQIIDTVARAGVLDYFKNELDELGKTIDRLAANGELAEMAAKTSEAMVNTANAIKNSIVFLYEWGDAIKAVAMAIVGVKIYETFKKILDIFSPLTKKTSGWTRTLLSALPKLTIGFGALATAAALGAVQIVRMGVAAWDLIEANEALAASESLKADTQQRVQKILAEYNKTLGTNMQTMDDYHALLKSGVIVHDKYTGQLVTAAENTRRLAAAQEAARKKAEEELRPAIEKLTNDLVVMKDRGEAVSLTFRKLFEIDQLTNVGHVIDLAEALAIVEAQGKLTAKEINEGLTAALSQLSGSELQKFQYAAKLAFANVSGDAVSVFNAMEHAADAAFTNLGLDIDVVRNGLTDFGRDAADTLYALAENSNVTGSHLKAAALAALDLAKTESDVTVLVQVIERLGDQGLLSATQIDEAMLKAAGRFDDFEAKASKLEQALKRLGIVSLDGLQNQLQQTERDFNLLVAAQKAGEASTYQVENAFLKWAEASIKVSQANGQSIDPILGTKAAVLGLNDELLALVKRYQDATGNTSAFEQSLEVVKYRADTSREALNSMSEAVKTNGEALQTAADAATDYADAASQTADASRKTSGMAVGLAAIINGNADATRALSQATHDLYWEYATGGNQLKKTTDNLTDYQRELKDLKATVVDLTQNQAQFGFNGWLVNQSLAAAKAKKAYYEQAVAAEKLTEKLTSTGEATEYLVNHASDAIKQFDLLDDANLSSLQTAIDSARNRIESMRDSAASTLESLQQQLAGVNGDLVEQERLKLAAQRNELELQLAKARQAGDAESIRNLEQSLNLMDEIEFKQMRAARERQKEMNDQAKADAEKPQTATSKTPTVTPANETAVVMESAKLGVVEVVKFDININGKQATAFTPVGDRNDLFDALSNFKKTSM